MPVKERTMTTCIGWLRKLALKAAIKRRDDSQEFGGIRLRKLPGDCLAIHRLLCRCKPRVIVEMGSAHGGSALMMASWADCLGLEEIISVDVQDVPKPQHRLIRFLTGDSSCPEFSEMIHGLVGGRTCSLILDSDHNAPHVRKELALYHDLVGSGQALIVEDTLVDVLNFRKFRAEGGPLRALREFLQSHPDFVEADGVEPYLTTNFFGYLVRA
jgi:cephalosporin hydroxylase